MNLGYSGRIIAHHRQIREIVETALSLIGEKDTLQDIIARFNENHKIPLHHEEVSKGTIMPYYCMPVISKTELQFAYDDARNALKNIEKNPDDLYYAERVASLGSVIPALAWILERKNRGEESSNGNLTIETDAVSVRLMAAAWDERESRFEGQGEESPIFHETRFARALQNNRQSNTEKARRLIERMFASHGDSAHFRENYTIADSDVPDLMVMTIEVIYGRAIARTQFRGNNIRWINGEDILIQQEIPLALTSAMPEKSLDQCFLHPVTKGLGLTVQGISHLRANDKNNARIITDAWTAPKLIALPIKLGRDDVE